MKKIILILFIILTSCDYQHGRSFEVVYRVIPNNLVVTDSSKTPLFDIKYEVGRDKQEYLENVRAPFESFENIPEGTRAQVAIYSDSLFTGRLIVSVGLDTVIDNTYSRYPNDIFENFVVR